MMMIPIFPFFFFFFFFFLFFCVGSVLLVFFALCVVLLRYSVCLNLQLFVGGRMSYLRCLCLLCIVVSNTYSVVFLFCFHSSCVHYVSGCTGLSIFDCPFGFLERLFPRLVCVSSLYFIILRREHQCALY